MHLNEYPYPSRRRVVLAANGAVATAQPLAAAAGLAVLRAGGNAVDAAIATAIALTVVEPTSNGIGGDAFALVWHAGELSALNGSGAWPAAADARALLDSGAREVPELGWPSVTVPGAPAAWRDLHARFGRLPFRDLLAPALEYAEQGFPVSPVVAHYWQLGAQRFLSGRDPALAGWAETFAPQGSVPREGQMFRAPGHAASLRRLSEAGVDDFYTGQLAEAIDAYARRTGGWLRAQDLAAHHSEWVEPIDSTYRGHQIWQVPPNCPGITTLLGLSILEGFDLASTQHASADAWHLQIEALKLALEDVQPRLADPRHVAVPVSDWLAHAHVSARRSQISELARSPGPTSLLRGGTVYLCTADRDGMMVSYIQSNYMGFGSGVVVPGYGISLHNRGACFTLEQGHPNAAEPGKRPRHTIMPGFITRDGMPIGPFGVMGGEMQPQGQLQVVSSVLDHGLNVQAALDAPRFRVLGGTDVAVEPEVKPALVEALRRRGHHVQVASSAAGFGRGQMIWRLDQGAYAVGTEPRADGGIAVW
jgi:gamma-glutamyltranspeptidase / glutathione hydrolase